MPYKPTLGGICFAYNAISMDYCLAESVASLKALCDEVIVLDAGSTDRTDELIKSFEDDKTQVVLCGNDEWTKQRGREKLSYFQNLAASFLTTDYCIVAQADEVFHEKSFSAIREVVDRRLEGAYVTRINLWGSTQTKLNVPHDRSPVGTQICRIAKVKYLSIDDAESVDCPLATTEYLDRIRLYHMGFVRRKEVMKSKIIHMQKDVFELENYDPKLDKMDIFDWTAWFSDKDLTPIQEELPKFIKKWAQTRP